MLVSLAGVPLLGAVDDCLAHPFGVHRREQGEEELLLWFAMALSSPSIWDAVQELIDVLDLVPHIGDGELRPLGNSHRCDLIIPKDLLFACEYLMQESHRAILLFWEENVLIQIKRRNVLGARDHDTYRFVDHEVVETLLGLVLLAQLLHCLLIRFKVLL